MYREWVFHDATARGLRRYAVQSLTCFVVEVGFPPGTGKQTREEWHQ
jgi:hypothetical protein